MRNRFIIVMSQGARQAVNLDQVINIIERGVEQKFCSIITTDGKTTPVDMSLDSLVSVINSGQADAIIGPVVMAMESDTMADKAITTVLSPELLNSSIG